MGCLPDSVIIVGAARSKLSHVSSAKKYGTLLQVWTCRNGDRFAASLFYQPVIFDSPDSFDSLSAMLHGLEKERNPIGNKIFYLAISSFVLCRYRWTLLGAPGLSRESEHGNGWVRVRRGKAFWQQFEDRRPSQRYVSQAFRRAPNLQDRPLCCQGNRSECPDVPLWNCDL